MRTFIFFSNKNKYMHIVENVKVKKYKGTDSTRGKKHLILLPPREVFKTSSILSSI